VRVDARAHGRKRLRSAGQEGGDHARQDVARAGRGEAGAAEPVHGQALLLVVPARPLDDDRVVALQDDDRPAALRGLARASQPRRGHVRRLALQKPAELSGVRRDDSRGAALGEQLELPGERVQPVGVDEQRALHLGGEDASEGEGLA
jgi:hypothetical protein